MNEIKNIFNTVKIIKEKYEIANEFKPQFNIFSILRNESDEVNLHSKFIYELLGSIPHYSDKFLDSFLTTIECDNFLKDEETIKIKREYKNIDLFIANEDQAIIIENKIWADDGDKQLENYYNKIKKECKYKDIFVYYLTLDGKAPSKQSQGKLESHLIKCISYENHISKWIKKCVKESVVAPNLRETLIQYLEVIDKLSGKDKNMDEVAKYICQSNDNLELAKIISNGFINAQKNIQLKFWKSLEKNLKSSDMNPLYLKEWSYTEKKVHDFYDKKKNNTYYGLIYEVIELRDGYSISLYVEVCWRVYWGFGLLKDKKRVNNCNSSKFENFRKEVENILKNMNKGVHDTNNDWWMATTYPTPKINFREFSENIQNFCDDEHLHTVTKKIAREIVKAKDILRKSNEVKNMLI